MCVCVCVFDCSLARLIGLLGNQKYLNKRPHIQVNKQVNAQLINTCREKVTEQAAELLGSVRQR